jgi:hypothetical protein
MASIVVAGALANKPRNGGEAWVRMSWVEGFRRLGFDVVFIEQVERGRTPASAVDYFKRTVAEFGLRGAAALLDGTDAAVTGLSPHDTRERVGEAVALVNISGNIALPSLLAAARRRVYVDIDPGFTQIWSVQGSRAARLAGHDVYFTVGENIGAPGCSIPTLGIDWRPLPPPVVLDRWPVVAAQPSAPLTTVTTWRNPFGPLEHDGVRFATKHHEWRRVVELPARVPQPLELALEIHPGDRADREALLRHGWRVRDAADVAGDAEAFQRYVQGSAGEFSVANGVYVQTGSGWFSDRSVRYLASGKPVLLQDTGFSRRYPVGDGLLSFRTLGEAVRGALRIARDPEGHARAARALAEDRFDSDRVLGRLVEDVGIAP